MNLRERILRQKDGKVIFIDFFDDYQDGHVRNILMELTREGVLVRLSKGVYYKPVRTRLGILYPEVEDVIAAIAKRDHAKILPTGNTAMYQLGLTTQIPMNYEFLTNGAARKLTIDNRTITLKHGVANNFAFKGKLMPVVHQTMRAIGAANIDETMLGQIRSLLQANPEPRTIKHDMQLLPAWERKIVGKLIVKSEQCIIRAC